MWLIDFLIRAFTYATPLALAALGEALVERSGLTNLGVEGMMAFSAALAVFIGSQYGLIPAFLSAILGSLALIYLFGLLVRMGANQIVVGLSLVFLGIGLGELVGSYINAPSPTLSITLLFFDPLELLAMIASALLYAFLKTWRGKALTAVGISESDAKALGVNVWKVRFLALTVSGVLTGLAGAYIPLVMFEGKWFSGITAGWGWLAIGMVILGMWNPIGVYLASYFFGALFVFEPLLASMIPLEIARTLPYVAVIVALVIASRLKK